MQDLFNSNNQQKVNGIGKRVNEIKPKVMFYKLKFADSARLWHVH